MANGRIQVMAAAHTGFALNELAQIPTSPKRRRSECLMLELEDGITAAKGRLMA